MPHRIPDIELLRAFRQVARDKSFTRAAASVNVTQSAISHRVKKLEEQIDKKLFLRNPHKVHLTSAGEELLAQITPAIELLEEAFDRLPGPAKNVLQIELESAFASNWLTPRLSEFTKQHPGVDVQFRFSRKQPEFAEETELAIKWGDGRWAGLQATWLMGSEITPMCAPSLIERIPLRSPQDLTNHALLHDRDTRSWETWVKSTGVTGLEIDSGHVFQDTLALQQAAIDGHGVALYPLELGQRAIGRGDLAMPLPDFKIPGPGQYYLLQRSDALTPVANSFVSWLKGAIGLQASKT